MALKLYNSLTKKLEEFEPLEAPEVRMYNCGPTVYKSVHLGNWRAFVFADVLRRYLEYSGYTVKQVMNITDVGHMVDDADAGEDKMEKSARETGQTPEEIARFFEAEFLREAGILNIEPAWKYPRASEHIPEMIKMVEKLLEQGYAYEVNGSVYFAVDKFPEYGQLSGNSLEQLRAGTRVEINPDKRNPLDFALWVYNPEHTMFWKSPWNDHGYPGWHLECSAMAEKYLGKSFDIHTGGEDNIFPHHECEIAQSTGANGCAPARFWLHAKHLLVEGEKMSKSEGNFYTLQDLLDKGYEPLAIRLLLIGSHYRAQLNFTFKGLEAAQKNLNKVREGWKYLETSGEDGAGAGTGTDRASGKGESTAPSAKEWKDFRQKWQADFAAALDNDLNTAEAWSVTLAGAKSIGGWKLTAEQRAEGREILERMDKVWGLNLASTEAREAEVIPAEVQKLLDERAAAREDKNWKLSDELRGRLAELGWSVEDTARGQKVEKI